MITDLTKATRAELFKQLQEERDHSQRLATERLQAIRSVNSIKEQMDGALKLEKAQREKIASIRQSVETAVAVLYPAELRIAEQDIDDAPPEFWALRHIYNLCR